MIWQCAAGPLLVGVVYVVLGGMARAGRLPLNGLAGVRLPSTTASPQAWDAAHRATAPGMLGVGVLSALVGLVLLALWSAGIRPSDLVLGVITLAWAICLVVATLALVRVADHAARAASGPGRG